MISVNIGDDSSIVVVFDTAGNLYYPITCVYETFRHKIFLAMDPVAGAAVLESHASISTLTGGVVTNCAYVAFTSSSKP